MSVAWLRPSHGRGSRGKAREGRRGQGAGGASGKAREAGTCICATSEIGSWNSGAAGSGTSRQQLPHPWPELSRTFCGELRGDPRRTACAKTCWGRFLGGPWRNPRGGVPRAVQDVSCPRVGQTPPDLSQRLPGRSLPWDKPRGVVPKLVQVHVSWGARRQALPVRLQGCPGRLLGSSGGIPAGVSPRAAHNVP